MSVSDEDEIDSMMLSAGFDTEGLSSAVWPGGETEALTRLERHLERKVSKFRHKPEENCPNSFPNKAWCSQIPQSVLGLLPFCAFVIENKHVALL